jgi:3-deoxy-D-manno-octulosonic-acid transferase
MQCPVYAHDISAHTLATKLSKKGIEKGYEDTQPADIAAFLDKIKTVDETFTANKGEEKKHVIQSPLYRLQAMLRNMITEIIDRTPTGWPARILYIVLRIANRLFRLRGNLFKQVLNMIFWLPRSMKKDLLGKDIIWVNAGGVGEWNVATPIINELQKRYPSHSLLLSSSAHEQHAYMKKKFPKAHIVYTPLNHPFFLKHALKNLKVRMLIMIETPAGMGHHCINAVHEQGGKTMLVNTLLPKALRARKSQTELMFNARRKAYSDSLGKKRLKGFYDSIDLFLMQNSRDEAKIITRGAHPERTFVTGNLKFDMELQPLDEKGQEDLYRTLGLSHKPPIIVAGSTHAGEHEMMLAAYEKLKKKYPDLVLILAPRLINEAPALYDEIHKTMSCIKKSDIDTHGVTPDTKTEVILVDTYGELSKMYSIATIALVGGSFKDAHGGHSIIEPSNYKKPVICGPNMENFQIVLNAFTAKQAVVQVTSDDGLYVAFDELLADEKLRAALGDNAFAVTEEHRGAFDKTIKNITALYSPEDTVRENDLPNNKKKYDAQEIVNILARMSLTNNEQERFSLLVDEGEMDVFSHPQIHIDKGLFYTFKSIFWKVVCVRFRRSDGTLSDAFINMKIHRFKPWFIHITYTDMTDLKGKGLYRAFLSQLLEQFPFLTIKHKPAFKYDEGIRLYESAGFDINEPKIYAFSTGKIDIAGANVAMVYSSQSEEKAQAAYEKLQQGKQAQQTTAVKPSLAKTRPPWYLHIIFSWLMPRLFNDQVLLVNGLDNLRTIEDTPVIFAFNHLKALDSFLIRTAIYKKYGRYIHAVRRDSYGPLFSRFMQNIPAHPQTYGSTTERIINTLKSGRDVCMAPTGQADIKEDDQFDINNWKTGVGYSAIQANAPIVPVTINIEMESLETRRARHIMWDLVLHAFPWLQRLGVLPFLSKIFYKPSKMQFTLTFGKPLYVEKESLTKKDMPTKQEIQEGVLEPLRDSIQEPYHRHALKEAEEKESTLYTELSSVQKPHFIGYMSILLSDEDSMHISKASEFILCDNNNAHFFVLEAIKSKSPTEILLEKTIYNLADEINRAAGKNILSFAERRTVSVEQIASARLKKWAHEKGLNELTLIRCATDYVQDKSLENPTSIEAQCVSGELFKDGDNAPGRLNSLWLSSQKTNIRFDHTIGNNDEYETLDELLTLIDTKGDPDHFLWRFVFQDNYIIDKNTNETYHINYNVLYEYAKFMSNPEVLSDEIIGECVTNAGITGENGKRLTANFIQWRDNLIPNLEKSISLVHGKRFSFRQDEDTAILQAA